MAVEVSAVDPGGIGNAEVLRFRKTPFGYAFEVATSKVHPDRWHRHQLGALQVYQRAGVDRALEYEKAVDGAFTLLFPAAIGSDGRSRVPGSSGAARP